MFNSRMLFILGAGASAEAGLPTGAELAERIAPRLDIRFDKRTLEFGDPEIVEALRRAGSGNINQFLPAARRISAGVMLSNSIDTFIDLHQDDPNVQLCGKLAIAQTITEAERESPLMVGIVPWDRDSPSVATRMADTWFMSFFKILNERVAKAQVVNLFDDVRVINFNYDRCLEQFLDLAIQAVYGVDSKTAKELVARLLVLHPYGSIGPLHGVSEPAYFGGYEDDPAGLLRAAQRIRTFTEKIEDEASLNAIRAEVAAAEVIVFLGFAFHPMNMELLTPTSLTAAKRVYATAYGVSEADCEKIRNQIAGMLNQWPAELSVKQNMTCSALFSEYWRSFSS